MNLKSKSIVDARFGQADRIKISRKFYQHDIESCILNGRSEAFEEILNKHVSEPFGTVEEIIGEIQIAIVDNWNQFHKLYPLATRPITIDKILKEQGYIEHDN